MSFSPFLSPATFSLFISLSLAVAVIFSLCMCVWGGSNVRADVGTSIHRVVVEEQGQSSLYWCKWTSVPQQLMRAEEMQSSACPAMCWKGRRLSCRGERAPRQRDAETGRGRGKIWTSGEKPEASGSHAFFFNLLVRWGPIFKVFRVWMNQNGISLVCTFRIWKKIIFPEYEGEQGL